MGIDNPSVSILIPPNPLSFHPPPSRSQSPQFPSSSLPRGWILPPAIPFFFTTLISIIQKPQKYLLKFSQKLPLKFRSRSEIFDRIGVHPIQSDQVFHKNVLNPIKFYFRVNPIRSIRSSFIFGSIRSDQSDQVLFSGQTDQANPIKFYFRVNPIRSIRSVFFKTVCRPLSLLVKYFWLKITHKNMNFMHHYLVAELLACGYT